MKCTPIWTSTVALSLALSGACGAPPEKEGGPDGPQYEDPGKEVSVSPSAEDQAAYAALRSRVEAAHEVSRADFDGTYAVDYEALGYDPLAAVNLDLVQDSSFALDAAGLDKLAQHGVVIQSEHTFPHFLGGLEAIYSEDLPVYVSADAVLDAVHQSYDDILSNVERRSLSPALERLLSGLRERLAAGRGDLGEARADLDLYLGVALSLLTDQDAGLVLDGDRAQLSDIVQLAREAQGQKTVELFGVKREEDFSQFKPRGHYDDEGELASYFRAMMWLGRLDFRLLETQEDGSQLFRRRQVDAMLALHDLFDPALSKEFERIDGVIQEFVGESDYMRIGQVEALLDELGVKNAAGTKALSDEKLASAIARGGFGLQRIASHLIINDGTAKTLPLNVSFALLGQRYVLDSHVFSNVVYDRTEKLRMMPDPLDVAFAALGNDQAAALLDDQLTQYTYQGDLHAMRVVADAHGEDYWTTNLYTSWLDALRGLSPSARSADAPALVHTETWGRRVLNAQLGSWAELRHDTILYAKQSYTSGVGCEFPDAYVEPYPAFWAALSRYAARGLSMADRLEGAADANLVDDLREHFSTMRSTMDTLGAMATQELSGTPFDAAQLEFINDAVRIDDGATVCGAPPTYLGWYTRLLFIQNAEFDPTIADVHTQPTDEYGNRVGRVLHVGTGAPRPVILTLDTCEGPRAYAGMVFAYHEVVTEDFERLTDSTWADEYWADTPATPAWLAPLED